MTVASLRTVDRWIGVPLCALLTLLRRLSPRRPSTGTIRRILFVKLAEQGSTVLAVDALKHAIDRVGARNVFFLVFEENRFILEALDLIPVENIISLDVRTLAAAARSVLTVVRRLRAVEADSAIDLEFFSRSSAIFAYLSGACRRVGLHSYAGEGPYRGDLLTHRLLYNPYLHTSRLFLLLVEALDWDPAALPAAPRVASLPPFPEIRHVPSAEDLERVVTLMRLRTGCHEVPPLILLNPNASDLLPLRRWDSSRYAELARRLLAARPEVYVVVTGRQNEAEQAERLVADVSSPRCISVAGLTDMKELLALYSVSSVLVTNDSGPAHFATLTPVEVVTLFGPETPELFAARTPRSHVLWAGLPCSPCVSAVNNRVSRCRDNRCLQAISVDEVCDATLAAYQRVRGATRG